MESYHCGTECLPPSKLHIKTDSPRIKSLPYPPSPSQNKFIMFQLRANYAQYAHLYLLANKYTPSSVFEVKDPTCQHFKYVYPRGATHHEYVCQDNAGSLHSFPEHISSPPHTSDTAHMTHAP